MKKMLLFMIPLLLLVLLVYLSEGFSEEQEKYEYVGTNKCKACHRDIYKAWEETGHAKAFQSVLDSTGLEDSTCFFCHTIGYGEPTGFVDTASTPNLVNVGCEACHGPGSKYKKYAIMKDPEKARAAGLIIPAEERCIECHTEEQSPDFDYEKLLQTGVHKVTQDEESE